jgi:hypothetical protein
MPEYYHGSCQCGAIDFDVELDLDATVTCNCSRCRRLGSVLAFTATDRFTLNTSPDQIREFLFHKKVIRHKFCPVCGIEPFAHGVTPDGVEMLAINVNCLDGVDARALEPKHYDGAAL